MADIKIVPQGATPEDREKADAQVDKLTADGYEVYDRNRRHVKLRRAKAKPATKGKATKKSK